MSGPDITVTLNRSRSQAHTAQSSNNSASASLSDEDGVRISPTDSQDYSDREYTDEYYDWIDTSKREVGPSESASRSSTSNQHRIVEPPSRRHSRREEAHIRLAHRSSRTHRPQHPSSPESVGSHEDIYPPDLPRPRRPYYHWAPPAGGQAHPYAPSYTSQGYPSYASPSTAPGQQLVPFNGTAPQFPYPGYPQVSQIAPTANGTGYFPQAHHGAPAPPLAPHMQSHGGTPYGASDMMHPSSVPGYFPFQPQGYPVPHSLAPSPVYHYQHVYSSTPARQSSPAAPLAPDASKDDGYAELKQMLMEEKAEREARETAAKRGEAEKIAKAAADKKIAEEIAAAAAKAAAEATTEAEKKAAKKAAEEATKAADEAAKAKAEADAAIAAAAAPPPEEKKKPIKFKDAVGRKFSFPFHLCATWEGMEDLIRQAFLHVDIIGPHVAEGHYDLIGPNNEIILPAVWETVIEPDWAVTMHMWPMPEPKPEDEMPAIEVPEGLLAAPEDSKKKGKGKKKAAAPFDIPPPPPPPPAPPAAGVLPDSSTGKKKTQKPGISWFASTRPKTKNTKAPKKP